MLAISIQNVLISPSLSFFFFLFFLFSPLVGLAALSTCPSLDLCGRGEGDDQRVPGDAATAPEPPGLL